MSRQEPQPSTNPAVSRAILLPSALLAAVTLAAYGRAWTLGFVNYDDPYYVVRNPHVLGGLSLPGIAWALSTTSASNWHPLTWISLMIDATIGGGDARVFHATNVLLHVANALLLLRVLQRLTRCFWRSVFVAVLFALHPLHVESVAWITERKDVLSTFFLLLTLAAYGRYARSPSRGAYVLVVLTFAAGLLAKPMLVSLPLVLLLLDFWPLGRREEIGAGRLLLEKAPLFVLAAASCVVTLFAQRLALKPLEVLPLGERVANALVSAWVYIGQMLWPRRLAVFYPRSHPPLWQPVVGAILLVAVSVVAVRLARSRPWLPVGWFWYLVTLLPVIGLVQVGLQARADRYTYVPLIGLFIVVAWGVPDLLHRLAPRAALAAPLATAAVLVALALGAATSVQLGTWRSSIDLFTHALDVTESNAFAHFNLADAYSTQGNDEAELAHLREAVRIDPHFAEAHFNLTSALMRRHQVDEVAALCREEQALWPTEERTLVNLGILELLRGNFDEAESRLLEALRLYPDSAVASHNLVVARAARARAAGEGR